MISIEQILLLQQKVESAVEKISQLQAENDALRTQCSELSNALSRKTEQLSQFEQNQNKIESGILKALERLNTIENTILNDAEKVPVSHAVADATETQPVPDQTTTAEEHKPAKAEPAVPQQPTEPATTIEQKPEADKSNGEFDIF